MNEEEPDQRLQGQQPDQQDDIFVDRLAQQDLAGHTQRELVSGNAVPRQSVRTVPTGSTGSFEQQNII